MFRPFPNCPAMKIFALVLASAVCAAAAPFELKDGDRVLLLGDALLERENTYGLLETRSAISRGAAKRRKAGHAPASTSRRSAGNGSKIRSPR